MCARGPQSLRKEKARPRDAAELFRRPQQAFGPRPEHRFGISRSRLVADTPTHNDPLTVVIEDHSASRVAAVISIGIIGAVVVPPMIVRSAEREAEPHAIVTVMVIAVVASDQRALSPSLLWLCCPPQMTTARPIRSAFASAVMTARRRSRWLGRKWCYDGHARRLVPRIVLKTSGDHVVT